MTPTEIATQIKDLTQQLGQAMDGQRDDRGEVFLTLAEALTNIAQTIEHHACDNPDIRVKRGAGAATEALRTASFHLTGVGVTITTRQAP